MRTNGFARGEKGVRLSGVAHNRDFVEARAGRMRTNGFARGEKDVRSLRFGGRGGVRYPVTSDVEKSEGQEGMWAQFALACAGLCALLFVPGALALRGAGARLDVAIGSAPLVSLVAYGVVAIALSWSNVPASTAAVALPVLVVSLVVWAIGRRRAICARRPLSAATRHRLVVLAVYVLLGCAATTILLVSNLGTPDSFFQAWDNVAHFNLVRSMHDSGVWSTLETTYYPGDMSAIDPYATVPHFYPAGWHLLAVMLMDVFGQLSVTAAANVVNVVTCAVVFPAGCCLMLSRALGARPRTVLLGAVVCLAFPSFPWNLIVRWTLYPNLLSLALLPAEIASFMGLAARRVPRPQRRASAVAFLLGGVSLALAQPNSVFSAAVFLAPWCACRVWEWRRDQGDTHRQAALWTCAFVAFVAAIWVGACVAPPLQGVVGYYWEPILTLESALNGVTNLSFGGGEDRCALVVLVGVGLVTCLARLRLRWLAVPYLFCCVGFVIAATGPDEPIKHILTGFWYTDPYRMAAMAVIFGVPVAAVGLSGVVDVALRVARLAWRAVPLCMVGSLVAAAFAILLFSPAILVRMGWQDLVWHDDYALLATQVAERSDASLRTGYDAEKIAFVERVLDLIGPDELVLNLPYDGSVYAYGVSGLNTYWRYMADYNEKNDHELEGSRLLRRELAFALDGSRPDVIAALEDTGARYLLVLTRDQEEMAAAYVPYRPRDWRGIQPLGDDTPGLETVLAEGDMRLYRIDASAWA